MTEHTLRDKVTVIGGGAKNLGGLISTTFAEAGAKIVVHYHGDGTATDAGQTVKAVRQAGSRAIAVQADRLAQHSRGDARGAFLTAAADTSDVATGIGAARP